MPLNRETLKHYKTIGHNLKPIVTIAQNGLSEGVLNELHRALEDHELIKVKIAVDDRDARKKISGGIAKQCRAELVQEIGKVALLYRVSKKKNLRTSNVK